MYIFIYNIFLLSIYILKFFKFALGLSTKILYILG